MHGVQQKRPLRRPLQVHMPYLQTSLTLSLLASPSLLPLLFGFSFLFSLLTFFLCSLRPLCLDERRAPVSAAPPRSFAEASNPSEECLWENVPRPPAPLRRWPRRRPSSRIAPRPLHRSRGSIARHPRSEDSSAQPRGG